jgi:hypothetical protein
VYTESGIVEETAKIAQVRLVSGCLEEVEVQGYF